MKWSWTKAVALFAFLLCTLALAQTQAPSQDSSDQETYKGEPVYRVKQGVTVPRAIYSPDPGYDKKSRKDRIQGIVVLSMIVTKEGTTDEIKIKKTLSTGLDQETIKSVSQWKFTPPTKDGVPVAVRIDVQVKFHLF